MSKSLGNFFTLRNVLATLRHPEVMRYFVLSSHYRGPINYSLEQLGQSDAALSRLYTALRDLPYVGEVQPGAHTERFCAAMDDDFNTPEAVGVLQSLARSINSARAAGDTARAALLGAELRSLAGVLGIAQADPEQWLRNSGQDEIADAKAESLIEARNIARRGKNWSEADRIRSELDSVGVILEDRPGGNTVWRRA
jgi:cysteinyl-tRNA synthetase